MLTPDVMAGGTGSRLWPLSRQLNPKQFLKLCGDTTILQQTLARLEGLEITASAIIRNENHRFQINIMKPLTISGLQKSECN